jgi:hypothetical protein
MYHCGSRYYTYNNVNKRKGKLGSEGEDHNSIVSLKFSIVECVKGSYKKGFVLV